MPRIRIETNRVDKPTDVRAFEEIPRKIYKSDPNWVAPLRFLEKKRFSPRQNPSLTTRHIQRYVTYADGEPVARVVAIVDRQFQQLWEANTAFFGLFECVQDISICRSILESMEENLRQESANRILGPIDLTTHDEVGLLVEGFDSPPSVLSPYNPEYYVELLEACGYQRFRDYHSYLWRPDQRPGKLVQRLLRAAGAAQPDKGQISIRSAEPRNWEGESRLLFDLYNRSFDQVWGAVPISWEEYKEKAESFRSFYRPELVKIAELGGVPVGFILAIPDINQVLRGLRGSLLPFGWLRLALGPKKIRKVRVLLLGVTPEVRGRGIAPLLAAALAESGRQLDVESAELALIQDTNQNVISVIEAFGCPRVKTYRLYEKHLQ